MVNASRVAAAVLSMTAALIVAPPALTAAPQSSVLPSGVEVVARHIEAIGGLDAYRAIQSTHARGRFEVPAQGIVAAFELFTARPARMLYRVTVPGVGRIETGFDGQVGWLVNPIAGPELLTGRQLAETAEDAWFDAPLHESTRVRALTTLELTQFDGRPAHKVRVQFHSGPDQLEYFDVETGLQIGAEANRATPQGIVPTVTVLRDYRKFGTLLQATTFVQRAMGFEQVVTLTSCEYNAVPDSVFEMPPAVVALIPR